MDCRRAGSRLRVSVSNTCGEPDPKAASEERRGIGLANTEARLQQLYGADHRFEVIQKPGVDCEVRIELPFTDRGAEGPSRT